MRIRYVTELYGADHAPEMTMMPASSGDLASTDGTALSPAASMAELKTAARMIRAAAVKRSGLQDEDDENSPDKLADEAVVVILKVPLTVAVVPDAESAERVKVADPP
jgi:hypothetical protein